MTREDDEKPNRPSPYGDREEKRHDAGLEAKRLAARRRVLLGLGAAGPLIVTFGRREALAADDYVCQSIGDASVELPGGGGTVTCTCKFIGEGMDSANECKPDDGTGG